MHGRAEDLVTRRTPRSLRNGANQYAIAAGVAQVDTDRDGYVDRIIAADTGGNIWRINVDYTDPSTTRTTSRAIGHRQAGGARGASAPIRGSSSAHRTSSWPARSGIPVPYDSILISCGDRRAAVRHVDYEPLLHD